MKTETYRTVCFKTKKQAIKNKKDINSYFQDRVVKSEIFFGLDERKCNGFYVQYNLKP